MPCSMRRCHALVGRGELFKAIVAGTIQETVSKRSLREAAQAHRDREGRKAVAQALLFVVTPQNHTAELFTEHQRDCNVTRPSLFGTLSFSSAF